MPIITCIKQCNIESSQPSLYRVLKSVTKFHGAKVFQIIFPIFYLMDKVCFQGNFFTFQSSVQKKTVSSTFKNN